MEIRAIQPDSVRRPVAPYSSVVTAGDMVFVAGQAPFDVHGNLVGADVREQTVQVLDNLRGCLQAAGCDLSRVVKVGAFLASLDDFASFDEVYQEYFSEPRPVRTTIEAGLRGFLVEVDAIAVRE